MRRTTALMSAVLVMLAWVVSAPSAVAEGVWHQSVGRSSETAACPDESYGSPWQANWAASERAWRPSWGWWMNGGRGGWTCDRQITWAVVPVYPSAGCVQFNSNTWVNFGGGWSLNGQTGGLILFDTAECTTNYGPSTEQLVYAPPGFDPTSLCQTAFGHARNVRERIAPVYDCQLTA